MALVVRCPLCGCIYSVTPQELGRAGGTLRCGVCQTRFKADGESLRAIDDASLASLVNGAAPARGVVHTATPVFTSGSEESGTAAPDKDFSRLSPGRAGPAFRRREEKPEKTGRTWLFAAGSLVLALLAAWQMISVFGDRAPGTISGAVCGAVPCVPPSTAPANPYTVKDFALESTGLESYEIRMSVINATKTEMALPDLEVTFRNGNGDVLVRKLLRQASYSRLPDGTMLLPSESLPVRFSFSLSGERPSSCAVRALPAVARGSK